jgi:hypothetical protein
VGTHTSAICRVSTWHIRTCLGSLRCGRAEAVYDTVGSGAVSQGTAERAKEMIVILMEDKTRIEKHCADLAREHPSVSFVLRSGDLRSSDTFEMGACASVCTRTTFTTGSMPR